MIKSLLITIDGSKYTESVLQYGITLAKILDIPIRLLAIVDIRMFEWAVTVGTEGFAPIMTSSLYQEESQKLLDERTDGILEKASRILTDNNCQFTSEKIIGAPSRVICEKAHLVDLVIIGQRGEFAKWETRNIGATLETVSRECNKPILVAPEKFQNIKKILAPYDGSDHANHALQFTGYLASKLKLPIDLFTISDDEETAQKILEEGNEYLTTYNVDAENIHKKGNVEDQIILHAKESRCDLIVMGAYGHSRIHEALLGSTTIQVMRKTEYPVILVK